MVGCQRYYGATATMAKPMAMMIMLCLAAAPVGVLAEGAKAVPCLPAPSTASQKPPPSAQRQTVDTQPLVARAGAVPLKPAAAQAAPAGKGAANPAFVLDPQAGTVRFGDGESGRRPPPGDKARSAASRQGAGSTGSITPSPCK